MPGLSAQQLWRPSLALGGSSVWKAHAERWSLEFFSFENRKLVLKGERLMFFLLSHTWFGASEVV